MARGDRYLQKLADTHRPFKSIGRQYEYVLLDPDGRQIGNIQLLTAERAAEINKGLVGKEWVRLQR